MRSSNKSPTFCVYPWIEQVVQPNGKMSFCCVAKNGGIVHDNQNEPYVAGQDRLADAWNSDQMVEMRQAMREGHSVKGCETCYFQEGIGKQSYRQMHNEEWLNKATPEIERRFSEGDMSGQKLSSPPLYLDLRLGNTCNLKCRSCNPNNSSSIKREALDLFAKSPEYKEFYSRFSNPNLPPDEDWSENEKFWEEVTSSIPHLRKVYLTGGEPTLIEKNYDFMQKCVESGHSKHIFLMFNVNGTNIRERFLEYLPHFEFVLVNVSIDGLKSVNEYIRYVSRWDKIDENFQKLLSVKGNVQIGVTPVFQVYNVLQITDLLDHIEARSFEASRPVNVDFLYATSPTYLDSRILPRSIKNLAVERLEAYRKRSRLYWKGGFLKDSVDSAIRMLSTSDDQHSPERIRDFLHYTRMLDQNRSQDFRQELPELWSMLEKEGFKYE